MEQTARLRILVWHVHGAWLDALVHGPHEYLLPVTPQRDARGRGRCGRPWPDRVREVPAAALRDTPVDVVLLQRPEEWGLVARWCGLRPGRDVPVVYVEHNTPPGPAARSRHPMADRAGVTLVHVTRFNALMWDCGATPTRVIEHGVPDPGHLYTGTVPRAAVVINDPVRRWRTVGTDLLPALCGAVGVDLYGMGAARLPESLGAPPGRLRIMGDLLTPALHRGMAERRLYLHTTRWTSLGLSLIEAMMLGMPVVGAATTEAPAAVPADAGVVSADPDALARAAARFAADPSLAYETGAAARDHALQRFGLARFLAQWNGLLADVAGAPALITTGGAR